MGYVQTTNLNGYWERLKKLLGMLGAQDLPPGMLSVVLAGDTREPGAASTGSYRRFAASEYKATIPGETATKWQFQADCVVEGLSLSFRTVGGRHELYVLTTAQAATVPGYGTPTAAAWTDTPDVTPPPLLQSTDNTVLGQKFYEMPAGPGAYEYPSWLYFPRGSALYCRNRAGASVDLIWSISGYVLRP